MGSTKSRVLPIVYLFSWPFFGKQCKQGPVYEVCLLGQTPKPENRIYNSGYVINFHSDGIVGMKKQPFSQRMSKGIGDAAPTSK